MKYPKKMSLNYYNTIIFDCDGVILNSNRIKQIAFIKALSSKYNKKSIKIFIEYIKNNGGVSRFEKFKYFFIKIQKIKNYRKEYLECIKNFANIMNQELQNCEIDKSLIDLIKKNKNKNFFVISASEQKELRITLKNKKLNRYFDAIYGSPSNKTKNLKKIFNNKNIKKPFLYIGDSKEDYFFAEKNNIDFLFIYHWTNLNNWKVFCFKNKIKYVKELKSLL